MTHLQKQLLGGAAILLGIVGTVMLFGKPAASQPADPTQCPPQAKSCKVVTMTPEEESTLTGANGLFDTAVWANRSAFTDLTKAWRDKLNTSPAGKVEAAKEAEPAMPRPPGAPPLPRPKPQ